MISRPQRFLKQCRNISDMSSSEIYRQAIEEQVEKQRKTPLTMVIGDFSDDVCEQAFQCFTDDNGKGATMTFKVYHMPKSPKEWKMFDKYMKLFGENPKVMRQQGLEREKARARLKKNPNCLLFALQMVWEK
jgi:hypothetical protein